MSLLALQGCLQLLLFASFHCTFHIYWYENSVQVLNEEHNFVAVISFEQRTVAPDRQRFTNVATLNVEYCIGVSNVRVQEHVLEMLPCILNSRKVIQSADGGKVFNAAEFQAIKRVRMAKMCYMPKATATPSFKQSGQCGDLRRD
ncbi:hypothetical protein MIR68_001550 [Amoeboaphelidium protococcarum]|nr:hypothetical protein MIR68_001550 [Amoeboaphelidium protococcarum]